jgi:uncharacterized RDD family membrane protein YckC
VEEDEASRVEVAPFWLRCLASAIDALIFVVLAAMASVILGGDRQNEGRIFVIGTLTCVAYYLGFTVMTATTPGKLACRLYVAAQDGRPIPPDAAILRFVVFFLAIAPLFIGVIPNLISMLVDPQRRAIHDRVAKTLVLRGKADLTDERWR